MIDGMAYIVTNSGMQSADRPAAEGMGARARPGCGVPFLSAADCGVPFLLFIQGAPVFFCFLVSW
jgi:hypothetical protein